MYGTITFCVHSTFAIDIELHILMYNGKTKRYVDAIYSMDIEQKHF